MTSETHHLPDQTLADFVEGHVDGSTRADVLAHLERCSECMEALMAATELFGEVQSVAPVQTSSSRPRWWLAVAAAVLIALVAVPLLLRRRQEPVARLVQLAPRSARIVEPRLSGGFAWAPYRGPMRDGDATFDSARLKIAGVAGEAIETAEREKTAETKHAAAIAMVLIDRPGDAIAPLRAVVEQKPDDVRAWNDLAAARFSAAVQSGRPSLLPEALAATDAALRVDSKSAEALFNRALILERLGVTREARAAWERYLAVDSSSPWAVEARGRLARLPVTNSEAIFQDELPRLEQAILANDTGTTMTVVARFPLQSRVTAEAEHLGRWGEAWRRGDRTEAERLLTVARTIGDALVKTTGESLLRESVAAVDHDPARRDAFANAHIVYRRGRIAYATRRLEPAERDLRDAAAELTRLQSPMRFVARYYAASVRYDRNELSGARAELEQLRQEVDAYPQFAAIRAQVRWELALCHMIDADWTTALPLLAQAEQTFRALGERAHVAFIQSLMATTFTSVGRPDDAWSARIRGFAVLSAEGHDDRLTVSLGAAARNELRAGRFDAALAMLGLEEAATRAMHDDVLLVDALVRQAVLNATRGDDAEAARNTRDAENAMQRIGDSASRERAAADVNFAAGASALRSNPTHARQLLTFAIETWESRELPVFLPEALLFRARAAMRDGDEVAAMQDIDDGLARMERHRLELSGTGVLDARTELFEEAIRLRLDGGDAAAAFAYAERARNEQIEAVALQQRLAGSGTTVIELVALPAELVAFCITERGLAVTRTRVARTRLEQLIAANDLAALHDLLIAPVNIGDARQLIVIPDERLEGVAFAALYDARLKQHLVQRLAVSLAPSAASLQRGETQAPRSALAVALPSGDAVRTAALPQSELELQDLAAVYPHTDGIAAAGATFAAFVAAAPRADVIHITGHTEREPGAGDPALVFADERVSWKRIARAELPQRTMVVLAACETLRAPRDPQTHALSLGGGFLTAGAHDVIGTLTPIADGDARELFADVHRSLAAGSDAAAAVRDAQLAAIARGTHDTAWQSIAVLTRRIPTHG